MVTINHGKAKFHYAILSKVLPLILIVPLFLVTSSFTSESVADYMAVVGIQLTVASIVYTAILSYVGIMFTLETIFLLPETGKSSPGLFGAVLTAGIAISTFIFAGAIFTGAYNPINDTGIFNTILSLLMLGSILMFILQAREELFHFRRLSFHRAFQ